MAGLLQQQLTRVGGIVGCTDWRQAVKACRCCCCKATCKHASLVILAASMRGRSWGVRGLEAVLPLVLPVAELRKYICMHAERHCNLVVEKY